MSLLKMIQKPEMNRWAQQKAIQLLNSILAQDLILEAYLFGSAVNGVFTENSDLDFIIVVQNEADIEKLKKEVYSPRFSDVAVDWIFKTKQSFDERKNLGGVCFVAARDGMKLK